MTRHVGGLQATEEPVPVRTTPLGIALRVLSYAAVSTIAFPAMGAILGYIGASPQSLRAWLTALAAALGGFCGFVAAQRLARTEHPRAYRRFFLLAGGIPLLLMAYFLFAPLVVEDFTRRLFVCAVFLFVYAVCCRLGLRKLKLGDLFFTAGTYLVFVSILRFAGVPFTITPYVWLLFGALLTMAAELNYGALDLFMTRRGHSMARLPPRIRAYNLRLLLTAAILIVLFRLIFVPAAATLWRGTAAVLNRTAQFFQSFLKVDDPSPINSGFFPPTDSEGGFQKFGILYVLTGVVVGGGLIALFLLVRKTAGRTIRGKLLALLAALRRIFFKSHRLPSPAQGQTVYFTDREESVGREDDRLPDRDPARALRRWRREYYKFLRLPDGREKFLFGYGLSLEALRLHGVEFPASATPLEILESSHKKLSGVAFEVTTWCLNATQFSPRQPSPATAELTQVLSELHHRRPVI